MKFFVDSIEREGEVYCAKGVCTQGSIEVGVTFLKVYKEIVNKIALYEFELVGTENHRVVALRVEKIIAYRRSLDSLPQGMTGEIYLVGEGGDDIHEKDILASE